MKDKILILILLTLISLPTISFAGIVCTTCTVSSCTCQISECPKGVWNVFKSSDCSNVPAYRGIFSNGMKMWFPAESATYYATVLCDDGTTRSNCIPIPVAPSGGPTTTTTTTTETTTVPETICGNGECEEGETEYSCPEDCAQTTTTTTEITTPPTGGGFNWLWIIVIIIIVIALFFLLRMRKKPAKSPYEVLYRKWSR